jgi:NAD(P)H-hydrate epimerase
VELHEDLAPLRASLAASNVVVDAIFGTGLDRPITGLPAAVIQAVNEAPIARVALDVPSGLDADKGVTLGACVAADLTVTFGHHKLGLLTPHGARMAGRIEVAGLGVPPLALGRDGSSALLIEPADVARTIARRAVDQYKNGAGHVVVFAGSQGHIGASLMASHAAMRAGAGLVTVASWEDSIAAIESRSVETMTARLPRDSAGVASTIDRILEGKRAVVIGPGFGLDDSARSAVEHVLRTWEGPTVFDADALSMFEETPEVFAASKGAPVLTPHPGELGRLLGMSARDVEADRFSAVRQLVDRARCVVVLKGAHTLIGAPEELVVINASGNPAMATGGAGDVLAGIVGALLCSADPFEAACAGVYLHGAAADAWSAAHGGADRGLLASEIADALPATLAGLAALAPAHGRWRI